MKKSLLPVLAALALFAPSTAFAQGALTLGAAYDTELKDPGIVVGGVFHTGGVVDHSRLAIDGKYWLTDSGIDGVDILNLGFNIDGQYLIGKGNPALGYGLIGINLAYVNVSSDLGDASDTFLGLNLGLGGEYDVGAVSLFGEAKVVLGLSEGYDTRLVGTGGIRLYFGGGGGGGDMDLSDF